MDKNALKPVFAAPLTRSGFKRKASTFYRQTEGCLQVVNLQTSQFGLPFYINLGWVPVGMEVEGMPTPKEHKCPIRVRLDSAFSEQSGEIERVFNLKRDSLSDADRAEHIVRIADRLILPLM